MTNEPEIKQAEHTPGPWRIGTSYHSVVADAPSGWDDAESVRAYGGYMIAESVSNEANARLIAAAPDLLAALEAIAGIRLEGDDGDDDDYEMSIDGAFGVAHEAVTTARDALAKVRGQ